MSSNRKTQSERRRRALTLELLESRLVLDGSPIVSQLVTGVGAEVDYLVPDSQFAGSFGDDWTGGNEAGFLAAGGLQGWTNATGGIGYGIVNSTAPDLIHHWKFDESSGTAIDSGSVGGLDLTLVGNTSYSNDSPIGGRGISFDGSGDYAFNLEQPFSADVSHTVTTWVLHDSPGGAQRWISWGNCCIPAGGTNRYFFGPDPSGGVDLGYVNITVDPTSGNRFPTQGQWEHWAVVRDLEAETVTFYRDGIVVGGSVSVSNRSPARINPAGLMDDAHQLRVGAQFNDPAPTEFLDGRIADLAIYAGSLSIEQIANVKDLGAEFVSENSQLVGTDIAAEMQGINASVYARFPFDVNVPVSSLDQLELSMRYDAGFVAYLNGQEVARRNAPTNQGTPPAFNASATSERPNSQIRVTEEIDLTAYLNELQPGTNLLAVHGLNLTAGNSDFLIVPELTATNIVGPFTVTSTDPADGAALSSAPTDLTVHFSTDVDVASIGSIDLNDVTVDGLPATSLTHVDSDTVSFGLPTGIGPGIHTVQLADGALDSFDGAPLTAYAGQFTIVVLPQVATLPATILSSDTARLRGNLVSSGGQDPTVRLYWGDDDGGTNAGAWDSFVDMGALSAGAFSSQVTGLVADTTYFVRAFASNAAGDVWAATTESFTAPLPQPPHVEVQPATAIRHDSATLNGNLVSTGFEDPTVVVFWGQTDGGTNPTIWDHVVSLGTLTAGMFSTRVTGLDAQTQYFFRALASNSSGATWATSTDTFLSSQAPLANVTITEFLASNGDTLLDGTGASSDWIEVRNNEPFPVNLQGWHLTDDPSQLTKWTFSSAPLSAFGSGDDSDFLVVFASSQNVDNFVDANGNQHANFALSAGGDYVALVDPNGIIASEFGVGGQNYPAQNRDISYGTTVDTVQTTLVASGAISDLLIPNAAYDSLFGSDWTGGNEATFLAAGGLNGWTSGATGVGYSTATAGSSGLPGDYNGSGLVDAADYVVWRNNLGSSVVLFNDITPGIVTQADYDVWKANFGNNQPNAAPIHHWKFDEVSGIAVDSGTVGNLDLTLVGDATYTNDSPIAGRGISFDGSGDYAFNLEQPFSSDMSHTVMAWVWHDNPGGLERWISWGNCCIPVAGTNRYFIGPGAGPTGGVDLGLVDTTVDISGGNAFPAQGQWEHWAVARDLPANTVTFYRNGQIVGSAVTVADRSPDVINPSGLMDDAHQLRIGAQFNDPDPTEFLDGRIADLAIFDGALSSPQVVAAMNLGADLATTVNLGALIQTDVKAQMLDVNTSAYVRTPFNVAAPLDIDQLMLRISYEDGFIAYLDGNEIARRNAPTAATWNSSATTDRPAQDALSFEEIDVSAFMGNLTVGSHILAIQGLNDDVSSPEFLVLPELVGTNTTGESVRYYDTPTPGSANVGGFLGLVEDTKFSNGRGYYSSPLNVDITSDSPGASIVYTTDGSEPTLTNGTIVAAASENTTPVATVPITTTTTLRAAAFKANHLATDVDTHTYIFLDDVLIQDGAGLPTSWGPKTADYELDQQLIGPGGVYENTIKDDLLALPTVSIVMDVDDLWGPSGIYSNSRQRGSAWERTTSFEFFDPAGGSDIQVNAGVRIHGGGSRGSWIPKHSLRLLFKSEHGPSTLQFPLFPGSDVETFDVIVLDARYNQSWLWAHHSVPDGPTTGAGRQYAQYLRDQWAWDTMESMGHVTPHARPVHMYLNGLYWGLHIVHERPDAGFAAAEFGGEKDDYDGVKGIGPEQGSGGFEVNNGDGVAFTAMMGIVNDSGRTGDQRFDDVQQYLDMDHFVDFILLQIYTGNTDIRERNWWATRNREPGGQFHFYPWDSEYMLLQLTDDVSDFNFANSPWRIHQQLRASAKYSQKFADHVQRHMFHNGLLTPPEVDARWMARAAEVDRAVAAESVRWGDHRLDNQNDGITTGPVFTYTRENHWLAEQDRLRTQIFPNRTNVAFAQISADGLFPNVDAPTFEIDGAMHFGGNVNAGAQLSILNPNSPLVGVIYYTIDGSDPHNFNEPTGISQLAIPFTSDIQTDQTTLINSRIKDGNTWSALGQARFVVDVPQHQVLRISELHYHPEDPTPTELATAPGTTEDDFEFVEIRNIGNQTISLDGVRFTDGVGFDFSNSAITSLGAGQWVLVVSNQAAFEARYGAGLPVAGQPTAGKFSDMGEHVQLVDSDGVAIHDFTYDDQSPWPTAADGNGPSLVVIDVNGNYNDPSNWQLSTTSGGTPGAGSAVGSSTLAVSFREPMAALPKVAATPVPVRLQRAAQAAGLLRAASLALLEFPFEFDTWQRSSAAETDRVHGDQPAFYQSHLPSRLITARNGSGSDRHAARDEAFTSLPRRSNDRFTDDEASWLSLLDRAIEDIGAWMPDVAVTSRK